MGMSNKNEKTEYDGLKIRPVFPQDKIDCHKAQTLGLSEEQLLTTLYYDYSRWLEDVKVLEKRGEIELEPYLKKALAKAQTDGRVPDCSGETALKLGGTHSGPDLLLFFVRKCPHCRDAFLRGELSPYPWQISQASGEKPNLAKVPTSELIKQGECQTLEFKETLEYDIEKKEKNKNILHSSLKTIVGFLNTVGGTLLIGVHDSGKIEGIERDLSIMKCGSNDRFELKIRNCLKDCFKPQPIGKVKISFEKFTEGTICRVDIQASKEIVHLDDGVYVREGNTTLLLEGPTLTNWIQQRGD